MISIYGRSESEPIVDTSKLTPQETQQLRLLLAKSPQDTSIGRMKEFDLNNPPHDPDQTVQPFPYVLYHHGTRKHRIVQDEEEKQAAIAEGWRVKPFPAEPPAEPELSDDEKTEAAALDKQARKRKQ